jgi:acetyltransferase-like isoleucine patch superfamily enzyme
MEDSSTVILKSDATSLELSDEVTIGRNVVLGPNCRTVRIGFGSFLGDEVYIDVPELVIGDYTSIHRGTTIHGYEPCRIGHNCWIGQYCVIDSIGGTSIGNNVGVGAQSQLWSHIKFGDTLAGCRWNSTGPLTVEDDVWFVGHCIVSPIVAHAGSMLMVGGVATGNMEANRIYAGMPAKDITEKIGPQFDDVPVADRVENFRALHGEFLEDSGLTVDEFDIEIVEGLSGASSSDRRTAFDVGARSYVPSRSEAEVRFMRFLLYDRAKFVPVS